MLETIENSKCSSSLKRSAASWKMHLDVARMAFERGLYLASMRNFKVAIAAGKSGVVSENEIATALKGLAHCYCELQNFSKAERLYKRALEIDKANLNSLKSEVVKDLNDLASMYLKMGRLTDAEQLLKQSSQILINGNVDPLEVADTEKIISRLYFQCENLEESEKFARSAIKICEDRSWTKSRLYAELLIQLAFVQSRKGDNPRAQKTIERAIAVFELLTGGEHPELADFLDVAAELFKIENTPDKALELTTRAKSIRQRIHEKDL